MTDHTRIDSLPPFGTASPNGAFTVEAYAGALFLKTGALDGDGKHMAYNCLDRSMWAFNPDALVTPADSVVITISETETVTHVFGAP